MRLINTDKLFNKVEKIISHNITHYKAISKFMNMITNSPTIETKQGEWIAERVWFTLQGKIFRIDYQCSECEFKTRYTSKFCPQCGAKMIETKPCRTCENYVLV